MVRSSDLLTEYRAKRDFERRPQFRHSEARGEAHALRLSARDRPPFDV